MQTMPSGRRTLWQVLRIPLVLAVVATWGLVAALLMEGPIDWLWSSMVALPVGVIVLKTFGR
jgi:hypothetical protein